MFPRLGNEWQLELNENPHLAVLFLERIVPDRSSVRPVAWSL